MKNDDLRRTFIWNSEFSKGFFVTFPFTYMLLKLSTYNVSTCKLSTIIPILRGVFEVEAIESVRFRPLAQNNTDLYDNGLASTKKLFK